MGSSATWALALMLEGGPLAAREAAADLLARIGPEAADAIPELGRALNRPDLKLHYGAARALAKIGGRGLSLLGNALPHRHAGQHAAWSLAEFAPKPKAALRLLVSGLSHKSARARRNAAMGLGEMGLRAGSALPSLQRLARDSDREVRREASFAALAVAYGHPRRLRRATIPPALTAWTKSLRSKGSDVATKATRLAAAQSLMLLAHSAEISERVPITIRGGFIDALVPAVPALAEIVERGDFELAFVCARALLTIRASIRHPPALRAAALRAARQHAAPAMRAALARHLFLWGQRGALGRQRARRWIVAMLDDQQLQVRQQALRALRPRDVRAALRHRRADVRAAAAKALAASGRIRSRRLTR